MTRYKVRHNRNLRLPGGEQFASGGDVFELPDHPLAVQVVLAGIERLVSETDEPVTPGLELPAKYAQRLARLPRMAQPKKSETPKAVRKSSKKKPGPF